MSIAEKLARLRLMGPVVWGLLKSLPAIALALLLGAGLISTGLQAWSIHLLATPERWAKAPEMVAVAAITQIGAIGLSHSGLNAVVMVGLLVAGLSLTKLDKLALSFGGASGEIDFSRPESPQGQAETPATAVPVTPPGSSAANEDGAGRDYSQPPPTGPGGGL